MHRWHRWSLLGVGAISVVGLGSARCTVPNADFDPAFNEAGSMSSMPDQSASPSYRDGSNAPVLPPGPELPPGEEGEDSASSTDLGTIVPPPEPPPSPAAGPASICEGSCPEGEICIFVEPDAVRGVCLRHCDHLDKPCDVGDPKYQAGCARYTSPDVGTVSVCVIFCKLNGASYPCPNSVDYRCKAYSSVYSICVAK